MASLDGAILGDHSIASTLVLKALVCRWAEPRGGILPDFFRPLGVFAVRRRFNRRHHTLRNSKGASMKAPLCTALLLLGTTLGWTQSADQSTPDTRTNAPVTRNDETGRRDWGWVGLVGLAGLAGLAGRNRRRDIHDHDRDRNVTDIRRAA